MLSQDNGSIIVYDSAYSTYISDPDCPTSIFEIEGARAVAMETTWLLFAPLPPQDQFGQVLWHVGQMSVIQHLSVHASAKLLSFQEEMTPPPLSDL